MMEKMSSKKILKNAITICLILSLIVISPLSNFSTVKVSATTQNDAVNWVNNQLNKTYRGNYGAQCVDLIKAYYAYLGVAGYAVGNACDYATNALPSGWTRVYSNYQPGDIAVFKTNDSRSGTGPYGHVGIFLSADEVGFNVMNQNYNYQSYCTINRFYYSSLQCAIRPAFTTVYNPQGCFDIVNGGQGNIKVRGWAFDRDNVNTAIKIHVYIGGPAGSGAEGHEISTGTLREDVNAAYPGVGNNHGFDTVIATNRIGEQQVYVYAINIGSGGNVLLGNKTVTIYPPATPTPAPTPTLTPPPTMKPIVKPTNKPTVKPTTKPAIKPTKKPAVNPTVKPTPKSQGNKNVTVENAQDTYRKEVSAPGITTIRTCKLDKHGKVCINWYKIAHASGYQIQYSTKKNFGRKKTKIVYGSNKIKLRLKANKKYYIRIRAFKYGNIKFKVYGKWSSRVKVRIKK